MARFGALWMWQDGGIWLGRPVLQPVHYCSKAFTCVTATKSTNKPPSGQPLSGQNIGVLFLTFYSSSKFWVYLYRLSLRKVKHKEQINLRPGSYFRTKTLLPSFWHLFDKLLISCVLVESQEEQRQSNLRPGSHFQAKNGQPLQNLRKDEKQRQTNLQPDSHFRVKTLH